MSWLDDMEAADPAYPDPDADPWASPGYVPDTSRWFPAEIGSAIGDWAHRQVAGAAEPGIGHSQPTGRAFTADETYRVAEDGVGLFLEYRDTHGYTEDEARTAALGEVAEAIHTWAVTDEALHPHHAIGRDWAQIRTAEASAPEAGLQASIPHPGGRETPEYQADAAAWGSGLGVAPDGPEAGE